MIVIQHVFTSQYYLLLHQLDTYVPAQVDLHYKKLWLPSPHLKSQSYFCKKLTNLSADTTLFVSWLLCITIHHLIHCYPTLLYDPLFHVSPQLINKLVKLVNYLIINY